MLTTAQDIMSTEIMSVSESSTVEEALKLLVNSKITGLPVVDKNGKMVGVYSDYDVIEHISQVKKIGPKAFQEPIRFSRKVQTVSLTTPLAKVMTLFVESRFRRLPVVSKEGKLVGIITRRDLLKLFYYRATLS